jgi:hypothetical protein
MPNYGGAHQRMRAKMKAEVATGNAHCWRCGKWIDPSGDFDAGHMDHDPNQYAGPEHRACNRATSRRRAANVVDTSREW